MTAEPYDSATYGDRFADVYDDWYGPERTDGAAEDTDAAVDLARRAGGPARCSSWASAPAGSPSPRARGVAVSGVDASRPCSTGWPASRAPTRSRPTSGTWPGRSPTDRGRWWRSRNTFFNLTSEDDQRAALGEIRRVLEPDGSLVLEAFVPDRSARRSSVEVREVDVDRVLLFVDRHDPDRQQAWSSFVELTPRATGSGPA